MTAKSIEEITAYIVRNAIGATDGWVPEPWTLIESAAGTPIERATSDMRLAIQHAVEDAMSITLNANSVLE